MPEPETTRLPSPAQERVMRRLLRGPQDVRQFPDVTIRALVRNRWIRLTGGETIALTAIGRTMLGERATRQKLRARRQAWNRELELRKGRAAFARSLPAGAGLLMVSIAKGDPS